MAQEKMVAYVAGYTHNDNHGLKIFDVDRMKGRMTERSEVEITNPSYISISHNGKLLYSIPMTVWRPTVFWPMEVWKKLTGDRSMGCGDVIYLRIMRISFSLWQDTMTGK